MKLFGILCTVALLAFAALGQQTRATISGRVTAHQRPVSVTVILKQNGSEIHRTSSKGDGTYRFSNLPNGTFRISVTHENSTLIPGGEPREVEIRNGDGIVVDFSVDLIVSTAQPGVPIREYVTVAADDEQSFEELSKTVNVIDGREMRDRADFALIDTLRTIPGFRVQQLGGFGRTASIKTRGLRNQDTAILIDGIRFRDAASITGDATPFLSDFTLTSVERIEVLRGSGSSLYGTNSIGGVIDFQTPEPQPGWHGQFSGALGGLGLGRLRGNISKATLDGRFGFATGASRTVYWSGIDGNDRATNTSFQPRISYRPTSKTDITAKGFISDAFVRLNSNPDTLGTLPPSNFGVIDARVGINFTPDADDPDDTQRSRFYNWQIVLAQAGNNWFFQAFYSALKTTRKNITGPLGVGFQSDSSNIFKGLINTAHAHIEWDPIKVNKLTAGYEFEQETFQNVSAFPFSPSLTTLAEQSSHTIYVQDLLSLMGGRLQLAGGFRAQMFELEKPQFNYASPLQNVALTRPPTAYTFDAASSYYFRSTRTKLRAHMGNGYRIPSLYERFSSFFGFENPDQLFLAGAPDLKSERSAAFDFGLEQNFLKNKVRLTAVYFYTRLINAIGYGFLPQPDRFGRLNSETFGGYLNTKGFISRGGEFSGSVKPTRSTDIFVSYTYTNSDQREPQIAGSGIIQSLGIPTHQFTLVVTHRIRNFWVNFDFLGASSYLGQINFFRVYRFKGNRRGDLTAGYNFRWKRDRFNLRVFGTVENIFDNEYFENGFRTPGINGRVGLAFVF